MAILKQHLFGRDDNDQRFFGPDQIGYLGHSFIKDGHSDHHDDHSGHHNVLHVGANSQFHTIQSAVDAAHAGDTIMVANGTYAEQVRVNGSGLNGLTIMADGDHVVITAPTDLQITTHNPNSGRDIVGLVTVDGADDVTIKGFTVDGAHRGADVPAGNDPSLAGIAYVNADHGVIDHVNVTGVRESDAGFGNQRGVGIYVNNTDPSSSLPYTPSAAEAKALNSITITHSTIEDFQKAGIVVAYANVDIDHNTVTGIGETAVTAQNGIQVSDSTGSVDHNQVSGIGSAIPDWASADILAFENRGLVIDDNTITGPGSADSLGITQIDSVGGEIAHNSISGVAYAIDAEDYPTSFGWPDPMQPGASHEFTFDYSDNKLASIGSGGLWFQPDASSTAVFRVIGTSGNDAIFGAAGNDVLNGGKGDDHLVGNGGNDAFVFQKGSGHDEIGDFSGDFSHVAGNRDVIDVSDYHFKNFSQLLASTHDDVNGNAVIQLTAQATVTLDSVHTAQLHQNDFIL